MISENGEQVLWNEIGKYFTLKEKSIGAPKIYLGGKMRRVKLEGGAKAWAFGSLQYVQAAVLNVEDCLKEKGEGFPDRLPNTPLSNESDSIVAN